MNVYRVQVTDESILVAAYGLRGILMALREGLGDPDIEEDDIESVINLGALRNLRGACETLKARDDALCMRLLAKYRTVLGNQEKQP